MLVNYFVSNTKTQIIARIYIITVLGMLIAALLCAGVSDMLALSRKGEKALYIAATECSSIYELAEILYESGAINSKLAFCAYAHIKLRVESSAGKMCFKSAFVNQNASYDEMLRILT